MKEKIYKAYSGYGKHPLTDSEVLNQVKAYRDRGKGLKKSSLYSHEQHKTNYVDFKHLIMVRMNKGMSYAEAIKDL